MGMAKIGRNATGQDLLVFCLARNLFFLDLVGSKFASAFPRRLRDHGALRARGTRLLIRSWRRQIKGVSSETRILV